MCGLMTPIGAEAWDLQWQEEETQQVKGKFSLFWFQPSVKDITSSWPLIKRVCVQMIWRQVHEAQFLCMSVWTLFVSLTLLVGEHRADRLYRMSLLFLYTASGVYYIVNCSTSYGINSGRLDCSLHFPFLKHKYMIFLIFRLSLQRDSSPLQ